MPDRPTVGVPAEEEKGAGRIEALVGAERARALFDRNAIAQATVVFNSAIAAIALWGDATAVRLIGWAAALWLLAAARFALTVAYRRAAPGPEDSARWAWRFTVGAAANGVLWGALPLLLGPATPVEHLVFVAFLVGGMAAGAALSAASHLPAFLAFTAPALLPIAALLLGGGERLGVAAGVVLGVFGVAVTWISRSGGRTLAEAVRLRFLNGELAERLGALAAALEARVAERTSQLEAAVAREREAERQVASAARLAMLGTLAGGVAHEINNPLTYLKANVNFVREELSRLGVEEAERASLDEALADAGAGIERVRTIVRHLMTLSRIETSPQPGAVDLRATLDLCADMVRQELQPRARLRRDDGEVPPVLGNRIKLVQVFLNLLRNAVQAIPAGDPLRHEVRLSTRHDADSGLVVVEIADTGCGIPAAQLERIWDPFFTTKPVEQGTGLGLSICRNVVATLGGRIAVASREGEGSTFTVWLRAADEAAPPTAG